MSLHQLKCWPEFFDAIASGDKTFEARIDDRGFKVGDVLLLQEYDPDAEAYLDSELLCEVTYLVRGKDVPQLMVREDAVVMSIRVVSPADNPSGDA